MVSNRIAFPLWPFLTQSAQRVTQLAKYKFNFLQRALLRFAALTEQLFVFWQEFFGHGDIETRSIESLPDAAKRRDYENEQKQKQTFKATLELISLSPFVFDAFSQCSETGNDSMHRTLTLCDSVSLCSVTICTPLTLVAAECRAANSALKKVPPHDYPRRIQFQRRRSR